MSVSSAGQGQIENTKKYRKDSTNEQLRSGRNKQRRRRADHDSDHQWSLHLFVLPAGRTPSLKLSVPA